MSAKASTAALESLASRSLPNQRRVPRHPAGAKHSRGKDRVTKVQAAQTAILREDAMNGNNQFATSIHHKTIVPVILRITFSLLLWTLGLASMNLVEAHVKTQRVVRDYPVDRAKLEHLQRWVNAGHDTWCRDPKLVASAALHRVAPGLADSEFELASLPTGTDKRPRHEVHLHLRVSRWPHHLSSQPAPLSLAAPRRRHPRPGRLDHSPHRDHHSTDHRLAFWSAVASHRV